MNVVLILCAFLLFCTLGRYVVHVLSHTKCYLATHLPSAIILSMTLIVTNTINMLHPSFYDVKLIIIMSTYVEMYHNYNSCMAFLGQQFISRPGYIGVFLCWCIYKCAFLCYK